MDVIKKLQGNATTVNPQADPIVGKYITQAITQDDFLERAGMGDGPANNRGKRRQCAPGQAVGGRRVQIISKTGLQLQAAALPFCGDRACTGREGRV